MTKPCSTCSGMRPLNYVQTVKMTAEWYSAYYGGDSDLFDVTFQQIDDYQAIALERESSWVM